MHIQVSCTMRCKDMAFKAARSYQVTRAASSVKEVRDDVVNKRRSALEITKQYLEQIARTEGHINSFITLDHEHALHQAKELDSHISAQGTKDLGPLAGVPIAVKDNICTRGLRTTAGSQILSNYLPAYDATAVAKLRQAGAIIIGKTNMDEFGMGSSTENSSFKLTRNPWNVECVPGGSSGGSAAAVAARQCVASLGSDTGGSIRQPAHFCGVVGLKPTYGRVSRFGLVSYASSLDVIGPMGSSVEDTAIVLSAIAGHDKSDATCSTASVPDFTSELKPRSSLGSRPLAGRRLGLVAQTLGEGVQPEVEQAVREAARQMEALGAVVEEVSLPSFHLGLPAYYVLALSEASSNLARYDGVRYGQRAEASEMQGMYQQSRGSLGPEVKRRVLMGTYALSSGYYDAYYKRAQQVRSKVQQEMMGALAQYDALLLPTAPSVAYRVGEKSSDPLAMYKGDLMTVNVNLAGLPALVLPCSYAKDSQSGGHLPIGLQLIGRLYQEADLLQLGHVFEVTRPASEAKPMVMA